jgi:hypothetical protein
MFCFLLLFRKNSAIQLGKVYEHINRQLQAENTDIGFGGGTGANDGTAGVSMRRSSSAKLTPLRRQSTVVRCFDTVLPYVFLKSIYSFLLCLGSICSV